MSKTKRIMSGAILLALSFSLLGACQSTSNDKTVISIGMWPQSQLTNEVNMFNEWKDRFEKDYPQYEIKGDNYEYSVETVQAKAEAHKLPTVFQTWFTEPSMLVSKGYIKDITSQLTSLGWLSKMDEDMKSTLTFDGKIYGVPRDGYGLGLFLNTRILGEVGLLEDVDGDGAYDIYHKDGTPAYPTTFQQIMDYSQEIVNSTADTKGILILSANKNGGWQFANMAWNFGAELEKQDTNGKWIGNLDDPKAIQALEWIKEMKANELLLNSVTVSYSDWSSDVVSKVAMAFVGSDVIKLAVTTGGMDKKDIAFVPMPKGPTGKQYSLFGGTPFVFSSDASDKEVEGALRFLEYMGRSPEVSSPSLTAIKEGNEVAKGKGEPIINTIKPWIDADYLAKTKAIEDQYINVKEDNYKDFFNTITQIKKTEVPYYAQEMYKILDRVIQSVLEKPDSADCASLLQTANATFNSTYMSKL
ncbi:MAG: hypothetical protein LKJ88_03600 [Bacilli bacterium]|nr:hypothetical protein [Bacilli bacterium]